MNSQSSFNQGTKNLIYISVAGILVISFLGWSYIESINEKNAIERERIASDERIKQAEIQQSQHEAEAKIQAEQEAARIKAEQETLAATAQARKTCAKEAENYYDKVSVSENVSKTYISHYNETLNQCFIKITRIGEETMNSVLVDVNEKLTLGICQQSMTTGEISICFVQSAKCVTWNECMGLFKPFMND